MFGGQFLNARYVNLSRSLIHLAVHSESTNILSLRIYFQSKGGNFFMRHPVQSLPWVPEPQKEGGEERKEACPLLSSPPFLRLWYPGYANIGCSLFCGN